jgi:methylmalonyl-CoA mutase N-terminal domain/subunit
MREKFQAKNPQSWKFRFHTQTSGVTLLAQQPENNVVRVTLQALAAVLGGTQSLHTNSRDEALALPSQESAQIALRTQQIIAYESGVADTVDPLGGSYFVESLTNQVEEKVFDYLRRIEEWGGMLTAVEEGFIQKEIEESAYNHQKQVESKEAVVVGLNEYIDKEEKVRFKLDFPQKKIEMAQIKKLRRLRNKRPEKEVRNRLEAIREACRASKNLMPGIIDAVKAMATLGEITSVLKESYGTYKEKTVR